MPKDSPVDNTDAPDPPKEKGKYTLLTDAQEIAEQRAAARRAEDRERDAKADARTDQAWGLALEQAEKRAEDAKEELDRKDRNWKEALEGRDKTIKFQWIVIVALVGALLVAVFDKTVGLNWTTGTVNAGGTSAEESH